MSSQTAVSTRRTKLLQRQRIGILTIYRFTETHNVECQNHQFLETHSSDSSDVHLSAKGSHAILGHLHLPGATANLANLLL